MKKTKNLLIVVTALLLVGVMLFAVACKNDKSGTGFQEVSENDRANVVNSTLSKIEKLEQTGMDRYKVTVKNIIEEINDGVNEGISADATLYVDGQKIRVELKYDDEGKMNFTSTVWIDNETSEIYYSVKYDNKTVEGKYTSGDELPNEAIQDIDVSNNIPRNGLIALEEFARMLENKDATLYADGDNIKLVVDVNNDKNDDKNNHKIEFVLIFEKNGEYKLTKEWTRNYKDAEEDQSYTEYFSIEPSKVTVTMPKFN